MPRFAFSPDFLHRLSQRWEKFIRKKRPRWLRYLAAVGICIAVLPAMPLLDRYHSIGVATLNLSAAIIASIYGGMGPGLLASLLSALFVDFFLIEPVGQLMTNAQDFFFVASYLLLSAAMSLVVSSLRQAYAFAHKAKDDAQKAVQARESVLAVVSHDLRNPLSSVGLNCPLLRKNVQGGDTVAALKCVDRIERSTQQMHRLIEDLLDAAKMDAGNFHVQTSAGDLASVAREAVAAHETLADHQGLSIFLEIDPELPVLDFDHHRISQVLANLLGNAIKFTPAGGSISVALQKVGSTAKISVRDTGPGLSPKQLAHVFERHWQAAETAALGAGLGLYISRGIVLAHGGQILAASEPGQGSTFSFTLPEATSVPGLFFESKPASNNPRYNSERR